MPLIKCPACDKQVSEQATSCPNCGHPLLVQAAANKPRNTRSGWLVAFLVGGIIILLAVVNNNTLNNTINQPTTQEGPCRSNWARCADNAQLVNNYRDWSLVQVKCQQEATARSRYGTPVWPWLSFSSFYTGNEYIRSGIAIAIEPDAQFSNGFGGMEHSRVICTYNLREKRVISVDVLPR